VKKVLQAGSKISSKMKEDKYTSEEWLQPSPHNASEAKLSHIPERVEISEAWSGVLQFASAFRLFFQGKYPMKTV
jgi:hypothetical protein